MSNFYSHPDYHDYPRRSDPRQATESASVGAYSGAMRYGSAGPNYSEDLSKRPLHSQRRTYVLGTDVPARHQTRQQLPGRTYSLGPRPTMPSTIRAADAGSYSKPAHDPYYRGAEWSASGGNAYVPSAVGSMPHDTVGRQHSYDSGYVQPGRSKNQSYPHHQLGVPPYGSSRTADSGPSIRQPPRDHGQLPSRRSQLPVTPIDSGSSASQQAYPASSGHLSTSGYSQQHDYRYVRGASESSQPRYDQHKPVMHAYSADPVALPGTRYPHSTTAAGYSGVARGGVGPPAEGLGVSLSRIELNGSSEQPRTRTLSRDRLNNGSFIDQAVHGSTLPPSRIPHPIARHHSAHSTTMDRGQTVTPSPVVAGAPRYDYDHKYLSDSARTAPPVAASATTPSKGSSTRNTPRGRPSLSDRTKAEPTGVTTAARRTTQARSTKAAPSGTPSSTATGGSRRSGRSSRSRHGSSDSHETKGKSSNGRSSRGSSPPPKIREIEEDAPLASLVLDPARVPKQVAGVTRGLVGLQNLGNTCFMNSVLQCLSNVPLLTASIVGGGFLRDLNTQASTKGKMARAYAKLIQSMWATNVREGSFERPTEVKQVVGQVASRFIGYDQQDAQEFLRFCMDALHEDTNRIRGPKPYQELDEKHSESDRVVSDRWWNYDNKRNSSVPKDIFCGQLKNVVTCQKCGNTSRCFDTFWDLSLPIPKKAQAKARFSSSPGCKLEHCLEAYTSEEELDGMNEIYCRQCKKHRPCTKKLSVYRVPRVLVVHLKRFSYSTFRRSKLNTAVQFPITRLDLSDYCEPGAPPLTGRTPPVYDLVAVSNHMGGMGGGHYTADCKNADSQQWYNFNDSRVSGTSPEHLSQSNAYLLFYQLRA